MTAGGLAFVVLALSLAGFLQGLSGFGFGLTAMALLPLVLGLAEAQAIVTLVSLAVCTGNALSLGRHFVWSTSVAVLLASVGIGVPAGFLLLTQLPVDVVRQWLGGALCLMVGFDWLSGRWQWRYPDWTQPLVGFAGGALAGAFNIGGPPLVAYLYVQPWSKQRIVATLSVLFVGCGLVRLALLAGVDQLTAPVWLASGCAAVPTIAAMLCGTRLLQHVPQRTLRTTVFVAILLLGIRYLLGGA